MEIFSGTGNQATSLGRACGNQLPQPVSSRSHKMMIKFHSDALIAKRGFKAEFKASKSTLSLFQYGGYSKLYKNGYATDGPLGKKRTKNDGMRLLHCRHFFNSSVREAFNFSFYFLISLGRIFSIFFKY